MEGKVVTSIGLIFDMLGVVIIGWSFFKASPMETKEGREILKSQGMADGGRAARIALRTAWARDAIVNRFGVAGTVLLAIGFMLQIVGTWL